MWYNLMERTVRKNSDDATHWDQRLSSLLGGHYRTIGNELFGVIFGAWNVMSVQQVFGCGSMSLDLAELPSSSVQPTPYDCVFSGDIN